MSRFAPSSSALCTCDSVECKNDESCVVVTMHIPKGVLQDPTLTRNRLVEEANAVFFSLVQQQLRRCDPKQFVAVIEAGASAIATTLPEFNGI